MQLPHYLKSDSPLLRCQNAILPLSFVFLNLAHLLFFYLGLAYTENPVHEYGYIFLCVLFAVFCGLIFLSHLLRRVLSNTQFVLLAALLLYFVVCYALAFRRLGLHGDWLHYGAEFIILSLPALFAGVCGGLHGAEKSFSVTLERISPFVVPFVLAYSFMALFNAAPEGWGTDTFGIFNYMRLAYLFMPFLLAHIIGFAEDVELKLPNGKSLRHPVRLRVILIALYSFALIATSTRGAYICVFGFCVLFLLFSLLKREWREAKRVALGLIFLLAVMALLLYVYSPTGLARVGRIKMFLDGLQSGQVVTENVDSAITEGVLNSWVAQDPFAIELPRDAVWASRGTLFKLAIKEFLKSPLTGMGPTMYSVKYGMYPHNVLLELLCETGIVGFLPLFALIVWAFVRLIIMSWTRKDVRNLLLFFMAYAIHANISGTVWRCSALMCALGYAIAAALPPRGRSHDSKSR